MWDLWSWAGNYRRMLKATANQSRVSQIYPGTNTWIWTVDDTARKWNPRTDLGREEQRTYQSWGRCGRSPQFSGEFRLMQRPRLVLKMTAAAELWSWQHKEDEEERARRGERKWPFGPIYKARGRVSGTTNQGARNGAVASIFADLLNKEDIMNVVMTSCRFIAIREDDITTVQQLQEDVEDEDFLLRIDMNQFKSIWGLMLGILLLGVNRPIWAGLTSSVVQRCKSPSMKIRAQGL